MAGDNVDVSGPTQASPSGDAPTDLASGVTARTDAPDSFIGLVLAGRYRIDRRLGSGGMGAVFAGTHLLLDRPVAVKVIKPRFGDDPGIAQRFIQEARAASAIAHPHVVEITDFGATDEGTAFFVMERLDGEDLAATAARDGPLPWQRVVHIAEQIARALAAAHKHGVVHRDIKPANCVRITRDDDPDFIKVLDFGLAKVLDGSARGGDESLTRTGALLGTPGYIAPELYRGLPADHRVDLYALGALMYKLLTGDLPPMRLTADVTSGLDHPAIPPSLRAILRRALAEDPAARYPTAQALAADLRSLASGTGIALDPDSAPGVSSPLLAVNRDHRGLSFTIGAPLLVGLLVGAGLLTWFLLRGDPVAGTPPVAAPAPAPAPAVVVAPTEPPPSPDAPAPEPATPEPAPPEPPPGPPTEPPVAADSGSTGAADSPPAADDLLTGSPAAVQKVIRRRCPSTFAYTVRLQWAAGPDGRLRSDSVKALDPRTGLNDSQTCALRQLARSEFTWDPDKTYAHTFKIGG